MKHNSFIFTLAIALMGLMACNKLDDVERIDEICFGLKPGSLFSAESNTKAVAASGITSFKCEATQGSAGSESASAWNNIVFTSDGELTPTYMASPKKYWPASDPSYNIYAVAATSDAAGAVAAAAPDMTFGAAGTTISMAAAFNKDVLCAYEPTSDITWEAKNNLSFEHIYGRISTVTVTAAAPCAVSDVTINLINPRTGGVYNIRTGAGQTDATGWSSLLPSSDGSQQLYRNAGTITAGSSNTGPDNDFYIVPGDYELQATWSVAVDDYSEMFAQITATDIVTIQKGKINSLSCVLSGDAKEITFGVNVAAWGVNSIDGIEFQLPAKYGGVMIAPAPLYYNGTTFVIKDSDWNHDSYGSTYGRAAGSYYFNYVELGQFFDSRGGSFSTSSGSIDNNGNKVSYAGYDDWRLPTHAEWCTITTGASPGSPRDGSTVNGNSGSKFAIIQLDGVSHAGSSSPVGLLIFPDGETITGKALSGINNSTCTTGVTGPELQNYLNQRCVFLPASGCTYNGSWYYGGSGGFYWSATEYSSVNGYNLDFYSGSINPSAYSSKTLNYFPVRLVR